MLDLFFPVVILLSFLFFSVGSDGLNLPRLIVNQLKWLDKIVDNKARSKSRQLETLSQGSFSNSAGAGSYNIIFVVLLEIMLLRSPWVIIKYLFIMFAYFASL